MLPENLNIPAKSGVYLMKDANNNIIYIGKANNLKKRIDSYLKEKDLRPQIAFLLRRLKDIDFIVTENEKEALILENNLIKKYKPRYNIQLKDDKNYLCIRLDKSKKFPRLEFVRRIKKDNALYFGPYPSARIIREIISTIGKIFPLRRCSDRAFEKSKKPCLYYEIGECIGPC
ncbi:MAG: GIY-YIG nuclease family protein, partial [Proteobacteria bacterium]|nr:GIY-YIG nuclease family protein [Pseudomonadota bacterium]